MYKRCAAVTNTWAVHSTSGGGGLRLVELGVALLLAIAAPVSRAADAAFGDPSLYEVVIDPIAPLVGKFPLNLGHDVFTQRNNNQRTGVSAWDGFNEATVRSERFGLLKTISVHGAILAQPLFMESVDIRTPAVNGRRSAVFVATAKNDVCAYNADPPFDPLWCNHLADPFQKDVQFCGPDDKVCQAKMACPGQMTTTQNDVTHLYVGIESTPVIDPSRGFIYVSYRASDNMQHVAALALADGSLKHHIVVEGGDRLWNKLHRQRASLLLSGDRLFVAFAGMCEVDGFNGEYAAPYQGWVYAFDAATLQFVAKYRTMDRTTGATPDSDTVAGGGIWQASTGLAADGSGNIFFSTGNATKPKSQVPPDGSWKNLSNSVVRLRLAPGSANPDRPSSTLEVVDWFTPYRKVWQEQIDMDLGAGGVVLMPGTQYLVTGGKEGIFYLLDANGLGRFDSEPLFDPETVHDWNVPKFKTARSAPDESGRDRVLQKFIGGVNQYCAAPKNPADLDRLALLFCFEPGAKTNNATLAERAPSMDQWLPWPHIHGTPVFGSLGAGLDFLYVWPEKDYLKSFRWLGHRFETTPRLATGLPQGFPGASGPQRVLAPPMLAGVPFAAGMPGGMLSLNVDRSLPGHGVLFASVQRCKTKDQNDHYECRVEKCGIALNLLLPGAQPYCSEQAFGMLRAFDPVTLAELWNDQLDQRTSEDDKNYWFAKWVPPTIAKGRVFHATGSEKLLIYGTR